LFSTVDINTIMALGDHSISKVTQDPAADAAAMLLRLGFAIFAIVTPSATLMSRWVIVVLVPIAAILIILSAMLRGDPFRVLKALWRSARTYAGLTALLLALWATFSLAWTPSPAVAAPKIFKALGVILLGLLALQALPQKMRASNLHLVTIGVGLGAVLILASVISDGLGVPFLRIPTATPGRTAVLLTCLGWAAAAWMLIKNRRTLAALLVALVFCVALFGPSAEAIAPMGIGLMVFALAWAIPERAGRLLARVTAALVLFAPLLALMARAAAQALSLSPAGLPASIGLWWEVASADPVRLMTGRGFDAAQSARESGAVTAEATATLISDIWYDLGLLGAIGLAMLLFYAFRAVGRFGFEVAPLALAGLASAFTYALIERGATQTWWMNGMTVFAIVLLSVERGRYRTVRPRAPSGMSQGSSR
jgi:hypothetical protein